jgi:prepilin-type N-terminal cleavage/methylation domain-containing protein
MKLGSKNSGFTLIEMMLVLAIVVLLVSMIVGIAKRVDDQGKERLCRDTIALIGNALEQFRDFGYEYPDNPLYGIKEREFYLGLTFPVDFNGFTQPNIESRLIRVLNLPASSVVITATSHINEYSGSEVMYYFLSQVPDCRTTLDKIDKSLITNLGNDSTVMTINVNGKISPLFRICDPWRKTLRYDYYDEGATFTSINNTKKTFPVITSAGPDKTFDTSDDITNIKQK